MDAAPNTVSEPAVDDAGSRRRVGLWLPPVIGALAAVVGLAPWLASGMRLPLQNLWAVGVLPEQMPIAFLPFSQYRLITIVALLVVGGGIAGLAARALRTRLPRGGAALALAGMLAVQVTAVVQTTVVVSGGLQERTESTVYLAALVAVSVLAVITAMGVFLLIALAPRAGAVIGLGMAAIAVGPWISTWLEPLLLTTEDPTRSALLGALVRWTPPILVGASIAWGGVRTAGRVAAALVALLLLWVAPAFMAAVFNSAGTRVYAGDLSLMLEVGVQIFGLALFAPELALPPLAVAIGVAALGIGIAEVRRARSSASGS